MQHPERAGDFAVRDVSFEVRRGEALGIFGVMGAGRTELLQTIFGLHPKTSTGEIRIEGQLVSVGSPEQAIAAGLALAPEDGKAEGADSRRSTRHLLDSLKSFQSLLALALMVLVLALTTPTFLSSTASKSCDRSAPTSACPSAVIILSGGIDLSVGAVLALAGAVAAGLLEHGVVIPGTDVFIETPTGVIFAGILVGTVLGRDLRGLRDSVSGTLQDGLEGLHFHVRKFGGREASGHVFLPVVQRRTQTWLDYLLFIWRTWHAKLDAFRQFPTLFPAEGSLESLQFPSLFHGLHVYYLVSNFIPWTHVFPDAKRAYSTVTLLARFRGLSTSHPRATAM